MKTLSIDIETYSSVDLAKCGVYKYTEATDFDILLFGYSADGNPVPDKRDKAYYETRPCPRAVETAARLAQAYLNEHPAT